MTKQINVRLDAVHLTLLEQMESKMKAEGIKTGKTDVIEKALYMFAREVLGADEVSAIIDKHYRSPFDI